MQIRRQGAVGDISGVPFLMGVLGLVLIRNIFPELLIFDTVSQNFVKFDNFQRYRKIF